MMYFDIPLERIAFEKRERDLSPLIARWEEIELFWRNECAKNPNIYNGLHFACNGIHVRKDSLIVFSNPIEYKLDRFASKFDCHIAGTNTIGIGVFGYDRSSENYYLVERGAQVLHYASKIHLVGGNFSYTEKAFLDFPGTIREAVASELAEEIELAESFDPANLEYMFVMYDETTTALSFRFRYNGVFTKVKNSENVSLVIVKKDELLNFMKEHLEGMSMSAFRTLMWEYGTRLASDIAQKS